MRAAETARLGEARIQSFLDRAKERYMKPDDSAERVLAESLHALIELVVAQYETGGITRFAISGDDVPLGDVAATTLAVVLHEQVTNSARYGALSTAGGRVQIRGECQGNRYLLIWEEHGGPLQPSPPYRQGHGTIVTSRAAAQLGGSATSNWRKQGLVLRLTFRRDDLAR